MKASFVKRIIAYFIDGAVEGALIIVPLILTMYVAINMMDSGITGIVLFLVLLAATIILGLAYLLLKDSLFNGSSPGKKLVGLKVVKGDATTIGRKESVLRNITWLIPILNWAELILPLIDKNGRRIGDKIAKTQVIEK
ncbi:RDD family protein [uncultured archaeon]|nr:RDD family protein [uncultured archaeon]